MRERYAQLWPEGSEQPGRSLRAARLCPGAAFRPGGWRGCRGSRPDSRGYTCGLWQLLHALASLQPEAPPGASADGGAGSGGGGARWLAAVAGFVRHFFQCAECAKHFVKHAQAATAVTSKRDAALWLWRAHNIVSRGAGRCGAGPCCNGAAPAAVGFVGVSAVKPLSQRLIRSTQPLFPIPTRAPRLQVNKMLGAKDAVDGDPLFPHVPWPPRELCPACRRGGDGGDGGGGLAPGQQPDWDEDAVYAFLLQFYGLQDNGPGAADGGRAAAGRSWAAAAGLCSAVFGAVLASLRGSKQYALKRSRSSRFVL